MSADLRTSANFIRKYYKNIKLLLSISSSFITTTLFG